MCYVTFEYRKKIALILSSYLKDISCEVSLLKLVCKPRCYKQTQVGQKIIFTLKRFYQFSSLNFKTFNLGLHFFPPWYRTPGPTTQSWISRYKMNVHFNKIKTNLKYWIFKSRRAITKLIKWTLLIKGSCSDYDCKYMYFFITFNK